jgi:DNA-binding winged helix-turn-helix (wHTH) protein
VYDGVAMSDGVRPGPLEAEGDELPRAGERLALEPNAFQGLLSLVQHRARVVTKDELQGDCV